MSPAYALGPLIIMPSIPSRSNFEPSTSTSITLYCDGACTPQAHGQAAGYGVYLNSPLYQVNICEPLPGGSQTAQLAEVKALSCALEVIWAMRPRHAVIISDSEYVVKGYNEWMASWKTNGWRRADGEKVAHRGFWEMINEYPSNFDRRRMNVSVKWKARNSVRGQEIADGLARQGCELNYFCGICESYIGREGMSHDCQPTCSRGNCDGRRFVDLKAYQQHYESCHSKRRPCRKDDCDMVFGSEEAAWQHECAVHDGYVFDCEYCYDVYASKRAKDEHEREECKHAPYCRDCERRFVNKHSRNQHFRDYHGWY